MAPFFAALTPCVIGIEACGSGHHWARELQRFGHQVRLMPPRYVRPYVKTNKHDAADAEAICEAVQRPNMRFVPIKGRSAGCSVVAPSSRAPDKTTNDAGNRYSGTCRRIRPGSRQGHTARA